MPRTTTHSTVPNQIVITIHREMPKKDFIQIKKENFAKAYKDLNATATILYLYLVGNADGYKRLLRLCRLLLRQLFQRISDGVEEKKIRLFVDVHVDPLLAKLQK